MPLHAYIKTELYSPLSPARREQLLNTSEIDSFAFDHAAALSALGEPGNAVILAAEQAPTVISSNLIRWGDTTNGIALTGSGFGPVSSLAALEQAIANGIASGAFSTMQIFSGGQTIGTLSFSASGMVLTTGNQQVTLNGVLPTGVQALADLVNNLSKLSDLTGLTTTERGEILAVLRGYDLDSLSLSDQGKTLLSLDLDETAITLTINGAVLQLSGDFAFENLGAVLDVVFAFDDTDAPVALAGLAIDGLTLTGADGTVLIRTTGSVDDLSGPPFGTVTLQGTDAAERFTVPVIDADTTPVAQILMGGGDDTVRVDGWDMFEAVYYKDMDLASLMIDGGAGSGDTLRVQGGELVVANLRANDLALFSWNHWDYWNYWGHGTLHTGITGFERVRAPDAMELQVYGGDANESMVIENQVIASFEGGAGIDRLELQFAERRDLGDSREGVLQSEFFDIFDVRRSSIGGALELFNDNGTTTYLANQTLSLYDVEEIVFATVGGGTETVNLAALLASHDPGFLLGTSADDVLSGRPGQHSTLLGQSGNDHLFGDGLPVAAVPELSAQVYRLYQATLGRDPDATGHQGWTRMLLTGQTDIETAANGFVAAREFTNIYGALDDAGFVAQMYRNVLGREASATEVQAWLDLMTRATNPLSKAQVALGFSDSREFINGSAADAAAFAQEVTPGGGNDAQIFRFYMAALGRGPDAGGFAGWLDALTSGTTLQQAASGFASAREFGNAYGTLSDVKFIERMYLNVLDRPADAVGLQGWLDAMTGGASRADVLLGFANSAEFVRATTPLLTDWMRAQGTDDVLAGGEATVMAGGLWSDQFVFARDAGNSYTVLDLEAWDTLDFSDFDTTRDALRTNMTQVGQDVVFDDGTVEITFKHVALDEITDGMMIVDSLAGF